MEDYDLAQCIFTNGPPVIDKEEFEVIELECKFCGESIGVWGRRSYANYECEYDAVHNRCEEVSKESSFYHSLHPFHLVSFNMSQNDEPSVFSCDLCDGQVSDRHCYRCQPCNFTVCAKCAIAEITQTEAAAALKEGSVSKLSTHEGHNHPQHTLILQTKPAAFLCNACRQTEKKDLFYYCDHCDDFLIHKSCATLPPTVHRPHYHHHPLTLVFSLPEKFYKYKYKCDVCNKRIMQIEWTYHCSSCRYFLHIRCLPNPDQLQPSTQRNVDEENILHLPMSHAFTDPLKQLFHSETNNNTSNAVAAVGGGDDKERVNIDHSSHAHPLFLTAAAAAGKNNIIMHTAEDIGSSSSSSSTTEDNSMITVCHCCVRPLSSPYYSCKQDGCSFTLHKYCAELPRTLQQHPLHPRQDHLLDLVKPEQTDFFSVCEACGLKLGSSFFYKCRADNCRFCIDVNCAFLPKIIKHEYFHKEHPLVLYIRPPDQLITVCKICEQSFGNHVGYKCEDATCNFYVDLHCALRSPRSLPHRYCKGGHQVPLMCPPIKDHPDDFYCEICEEEMNPLLPLYYCAKCKNSFHIRCLNRVYRFENFLLGGTNDSVPDQVHHHSFMALVRRKKPPKEVCFGCNGDINGLLFIECRTENCPYSLCLECVVVLWP